MNAVAIITMFAVFALSSFTIIMISINGDKKRDKEHKKIAAMSLTELIKTYIDEAPENTWWKITTNGDSINLELINIHNLSIAGEISVYENEKRRSNWKLKDDLHRISKNLVEKYEFLTLNQHIDFFGA